MYSSNYGFEIYMSSKFHESNTMEYGQQIYKNKTTSVIILNNNRICSLVVKITNDGFEIYLSSKFQDSNNMAIGQQIYINKTT